MPRCEVTLIIEDVVVPIKVDFEDSDWQVLLDFVNYAVDLDDLTLVKHGSNTKLRINQQFGQPIMFETELPPDEQLFALMHRLRPFILEKEPTYFNTVANILTKKIDNTKFREVIKRLRARFMATMSQNMFQITVNGNFVINSEKALQTWLNAFEFHRFREKREIMEQVFVMFPESASKAMFVMLLIEKLRVIWALAPLIMVITNQKKTFTLSV